MRYSKKRKLLYMHTHAYIVSLRITCSVLFIHTTESRIFKRNFNKITKSIVSEILMDIHHSPLTGPAKSHASNGHIVQMYFGNKESLVTIFLYFCRIFCMHFVMKFRALEYLIPVLIVIPFFSFCCERIS